MDALLILTVLKIKNSEMKCPAAIMNVTCDIPYSLSISTYVSPTIAIPSPHVKRDEKQSCSRADELCNAGDSRRISDIVSGPEPDDCR